MELNLLDLENRYFLKISFFNIFYFMFGLAAFAQTNKPMEYYFSEHYPSFPHKVSIDQDSTGKLYFLPYGHPLVTFDSHKWSVSQADKNKFVAFKISSAGHTYVATADDFGVLSKDEKGKTSFNSFKVQLFKGIQLSEVWEIENEGKDVYFLMKSQMVHWNEGTKELNVIPLSYPGKFFRIKNHLYMSDILEGVFSLVKGKLVHVLNHENFTYMRTPMAIMGYNNKQLLICNRNGELYNFNFRTKVYQPFSVNFQDKLINVNIAGGLRLHSGNYIIYSKNKGLFHFDKKGELIELFQLNQGEDVQGEIKAIFEGKEGFLWIAMSKGIIKWAPKSNYTIFTKESGLAGAFHDIVDLQNTEFLVASSKGLFRGYKTFEGQHVFDKEPLFQEPSYALFKTKSGVLVGGGSNTWIYQGNELMKIGNYSVNEFSDFEFEGKQYVLGIGSNRIQLFGQINGEWKLFKTSQFLKHNLKKLAVLQRKHALDIWVNSEDGNLIRLQTSFQALFGKAAFIFKVISEKSGLPKGKKRMFASKNAIFVAVGQVMYCFDSEKEYFYFYNKSNGYNIDNYVNCKGQEYFWGKNKNYYFLDYLSKELTDVTWPIDWTGEVKQVKVLGEKVALVGFESIVLWNSSNQRNSNLPKIKLRRIESQSDTFYLPFKRKKLVFPYTNNTLRFYASMASFTENQKFSYRYQLKGYENKSKVSQSGRMTYENLPEGKYKLLVYLEDSEGNILSQDHMNIIIRPPFYRTIWAYFFFGAIISILAYLIFRIYNYRLIKDKERLEYLVGERTSDLEKANSMILEKSREIRESLAYAAYLQEAILPNQEYFYNHINDFFILYQPKDEVSGDFYWFVEKDGIKYLAVLDCTGHGVPGAFMSIICKDILDNVLKNLEGTPEVDLVLKHLDAGLKRALNQRNKNYIDGLDIGLCRIDKAEKVLTFAGAHIGLTYIKDGQLNVIKGDRYSIGDGKCKKRLAGEFSFTKHVLSFDDLDSCYMYTDGFADQFGGKDGKKFLPKRLKEKLLDLEQLPMEDQEYYLNEALENWMEGYEQVDDILVFGFKP